MLYAGSSGFSYPSWRPEFYPATAKPAEFLRFYAERFDTVELNTSSYQLPSQEQFERWAGQVPDSFRFAVKMTKRITHFGWLNGIPTFCERVRALGDQLGPILVQLPETRPRDDGFLRLLLDSLDPGLDYAFEFRHPSWAEAEYGPRAGALQGAAPFRYLRLREPPYSETQLEALAAQIGAQDVPVYAYFKHEDEPTAPRYAARLAALVSGASSSGPASPSP